MHDDSMWGPSVQVLLEGLDHPEGPAALDDGTVVFVETRRSRLTRWRGAHDSVVFAVTGGSPNACAVGHDGVYVTQAGGGFGGWEPAEPATPSIQCVAWDGTVRTILTQVDGRALQAPNDLCFGADERLYFTDPGRAFDDPDTGWIFGVGADGAAVAIDVGPTFPNGIVALAEGAIAWVESATRRVMRRDVEGATTHLTTLPPGHVPDGFAAAADGSLVVCSMGSGGLDVVAADGGYVRFVETGGRPLNCAFTGSTLVVACDPDPRLEPPNSGRLLAVTTPLTAGPLFRGSV